MNKIRVADILEKGLPLYLVKHKLSWKQKKVVTKIINCCSPNGAKQKIICTNEECDYEEVKGKPCGDRHCNRCNESKMKKWLSKIIRQYFPLTYHHLVFTLPSELRNLILCNQEVIYDIFFKSCFEVLKKFGRDEKFFGGELGFIGLLHTWGQTLFFHPHIHFIVMDGGIRNGEFKRFRYHKKFLFPVQAMSKVMMGVFIEKLKWSYEAGELLFPGELQEISSSKTFNSYLWKLSRKKWVIFNQPPLNGSSNVLEYLSRYTHKIAISNNRIKEYSNGEVTFEYKDYKDKNENGIAKKKLMKLSEEEFIRRYLLHILPNGFRKLRYGGIFASNKKKESLTIIKELLKKYARQTDAWYLRIRKYVEVLCPVCDEKLRIIFNSS
ncbi:MAG: IS91 family transposase [Candidatus Doudnabacteria bacterium]